MNKKELSFVIGVYNTPENLLRNCLNSCLEQKGVDIEIVCVNDGATDNSPKILEEYYNNYPDIFKIIHQENKGIGPTREEVINIIKKYLIRKITAPIKPLK